MVKVSKRVQGGIEYLGINLQSSFVEARPKPISSSAIRTTLHVTFNRAAIVSCLSIGSMGYKLIRSRRLGFFYLRSPLALSIKVRPLQVALTSLVDGGHSRITVSSHKLLRSSESARES